MPSVVRSDSKFPCFVTNSNRYFPTFRAASPGASVLSLASDNCRPNYDIMVGNLTGMSRAPTALQTAKCKMGSGTLQFALCSLQFEL